MDCRNPETRGKAHRIMLGVPLLIGLAAPANSQDAAEHGVAPWSEAVISVAAFEPATNLFRHAGHWRLTHSGSVDRSELDYWHLAPSVSATFERWCAPQADTGCIRFVRFEGVEQEPIRPAARPWDTGGIFSVMMRSDEIPALYKQALELGWWAESPPIDFSFGTSQLRNVVLQGPHGINVAVYQRITPEFTGFPVGRLSEGFNSMRMTRDYTVERDFFRETLGFGTLFDSPTDITEPAFSNLSIPYNYTTRIPRAAAALHPVEGETGRVEVMQIMGFTGHDHSAKASPPNLGIISVRYPVRDFARYKALLEKRGAASEYSAEKADIPGIGAVAIFAVRAPDGALTEFYETPKAPGEE